MKIEDMSKETSEYELQKYYKKINKINEMLEYYDEYNAEAELLKIISGMHISEELLDLSLKNASGGQKSKIAFARLLYSRPEIMLLDEPTTHLDPKTQDIIANAFKNFEESLIVVSHNLDFVEKLNIDRMLLLPSGRITYYDKR